MDLWHCLEHEFAFELADIEKKAFSPLLKYNMAHHSAFKGPVKFWKILQGMIYIFESDFSS